nr:MAG TPA: hypothetical protein [Bacteriophage sp.]
MQESYLECRLFYAMKSTTRTAAAHSICAI